MILIYKNRVIEISRKGFTLGPLPGQIPFGSSVLMPRTNYDYAAEVGDGRQSAVVMACINWVQRTFPEAPLALEYQKTGEEWEQVESHPMLDLLESPNPYYDGILLQMAMIADFELDGNAYFIKVKSGAGRTVQLWWAPSTTIEPKWPTNDDSVFISHYDYRVGYRTVQLPPEDVIHFRLGIDPQNTRKGLSPLKSLFREVFTDDEAANMTASLLKNMGVPGVLISPEAGGSISDPEAQATKELLKEKLTGDKRGEPIIMTGATKITPFTWNPQQMDLKALRRIPEERVSGVFGIPAIVVGLGAGLDRSTFANFKEAREAAYESMIIPTQRIIASALKRQLLSDYVDDVKGYRVGYDLSEVKILQEDEAAKVTRVNQMVAGGYLCVDDAQRMTGSPVDENGHYYLRGFAVQPVFPDTVTPGTEGPEPPEAPVDSNAPDDAPPEGTPPDEPPKALKFKRLDENSKEAYWRDYVAKAAGYEQKFLTALKGMFESQEAEALENLKTGKTGDMINVPNAKKAYIAKATPVLTDLISKAVADAQDLILPSPHKSLKQADFNAMKWLKTRIGWAAEEVGEETARMLAEALAEGYGKGESMDELAARVKKVFTNASDVRALRIARTETIQASAQGAIEGYKEVGVSKVEFYAALDERLCPNCAALHEKQFPINESVGVITVHPSCRCVWLPVVE